MSDLNMVLSGKQISTYTLKEFIGGGVLGQGYRAVHNTGQIRAIKVIPLTTLTQHGGLVRQLLIEEVDSMAKIDNPNVVKIFEYIETKTNCYLVMEYCDGGNLKDLLQKNNGQFPQEEALNIFKQISNGMMGLHEKHIMHRDLKLKNIFLHQGKLVKIGDLGFSKKLKHKDDKDDLCLGTLGYMAPEVAKNQPYGLQADIFSMGAMLYELLYGKLPFSTYNFPEFIRDVRRNNITFDGNPSVSEELINLLKVMLKEHPQDRITFSEMYKLSLFTTQTQYTYGLTRTCVISNQIDFSHNQEFYEESERLKPIETGRLDLPNEQNYNQEIKIILNQKYIKQSEKLNSKVDDIVKIDCDKLIQQDQKQQQQEIKKSSKNQESYQDIIPLSISKAFHINQKDLPLPNEEPDQLANNTVCKQLQDNYKQYQKMNFISIEEEKSINELIQKYFDRFNSIQYLLNTLNEMSLIHFPSVLPIIYPSMILQKKALVEFKRFQLQLQKNENIFQSPVHEEIKNQIDLIQLTKNVNDQIVTQEELFQIYFKAQIDKNKNKIERYIKKNWFNDIQIEPSADFSQTYQEAMKLVQEIVHKIKMQKTSPLLIKFEGHLKRCMDFERLLEQKVKLSMEFDLK